MAVACFIAPGINVKRTFDPPKRASLRAWYNAATRFIPDAPKFNPVIEGTADVTVDTLLFCGDDWHLIIARRSRSSRQG